MVEQKVVWLTEFVGRSGCYGRTKRSSSVNSSLGNHRRSSLFLLRCPYRGSTFCWLSDRAREKSMISCDRQFRRSAPQARFLLLVDRSREPRRASYRSRKTGRGLERSLPLVKVSLKTEHSLPGHGPKLWSNSFSKGTWRLSLDVMSKMRAVPENDIVIINSFTIFEYINTRLVRRTDSSDTIL